MCIGYSLLLAVNFKYALSAVPRTGRKLSAYAPLVPLLILKLLSLLEQK